MTSKNFLETLYMQGHLGNHIGNGIYRLDKPFRINIQKWVYDKKFAGFSLIGTKYSADCKECTAIYFTNTSSIKLSRKAIALRKSKNSDDYGYIENIHDTEDKIYIGGIPYDKI